MPNGLAGSAQVSYPLQAPNGTAGAPSYSFASDPALGFYRQQSGVMGLAGYLVASGYIASSTAFVCSTDAGFYSLGVSNDVILARDAADVLAQRRATNAQLFRVYETYTDASNYRRLQVSGNGITLSSLGTGVAASGLYIWNGQAGSVEFATTNTVRWTINPSGHFLAAADNTYDIGANGATRPRTVYAATGFSTTGTAEAQYFQFTSNRGYMQAPSDGVWTFLDQAGTSFGRLCLGGTTSAFPALRRGGAGIDLVVADGTAWATLNAQALSIQASGTISFGGNVYMDAASDGILRLRDAATTSFGRLCFGGLTAAFPAIKRNGANLDFVPADGSASYIDLTCHDLISSSVYLSNIVAVGANNTNFVLGGSGITAGLVNSAASFIIQVTGGAVLATFAGTGYLEMTEVTAPSAPAANKGRLYFEDNGAGKTRLMCLFASGSAQQLAIEP